MAYNPTVIAEDRTALYRLYSQDGTLLYLGITRDLQQRMRAHRHSKSWWNEVADTQITWFSTRAAAAAAEVDATRAEQPKYDLSYRQAAGAHLPVREVCSLAHPVTMPNPSPWEDMLRRAGALPRRGGRGRKADSPAGGAP